MATSATVRQASKTLSQSPPRNAIRVPSGDQATASSWRSARSSGPADRAPGFAAAPQLPPGSSGTGVPNGAVDEILRMVVPAQPGPAKASQRPSGDQLGAPEPVAARCLPPPSAFITQTPPSCTYAIRAPSGDQCGRALAPSAVSRCTVAPAAT